VHMTENHPQRQVQERFREYILTPNPDGAQPAFSLRLRHNRRPCSLNTTIHFAQEIVFKA